MATFLAISGARARSKLRCDIKALAGQRQHHGQHHHAGQAQVDAAQVVFFMCRPPLQLRAVASAMSVSALRTVCPKRCSAGGRARGASPASVGLRRVGGAAPTRPSACRASQPPHHRQQRQRRQRRRHREHRSEFSARSRVPPPGRLAHPLVGIAQGQVADGQAEVVLQRHADGRLLVACTVQSWSPALRAAASQAAGAVARGAPASVLYSGRPSVSKMSMSRIRSSLAALALQQVAGSVADVGELQAQRQRRLDAVLDRLARVGQALFDDAAGRGRGT
jgi:hypothetical protein